MPFEIRMGHSEMYNFWQSMREKRAKGELNSHELKTLKKLVKTFYHLSINPKHPGLCSHEIEPLSKKAGFKIWESYVENHTPAAGRIFWAYGPGKNEISILGFEPHPENRKSTGYAKVKLSELPQL